MPRSKLAAGTVMIRRYTAVENARFRAEVLKFFKQRLLEDGFRKHRGDLYSCIIGESSRGWLGLNRATRWGDGVMHVHPVVGVHSCPIEAMVAELMGPLPGNYLPPTISRPLCYLMPPTSYRDWPFHPSVDPAPGVRDLVDAVRVYGRPYMEGYATVEALSKVLHLPGFGMSHQTIHRRPVAYFLLGNIRGARSCLLNELRTLGERTDLAAEQYRGFVSQFLPRIEAAEKEAEEWSGRGSLRSASG
jgi:hypothetical protein